jgi:allophanate hydrolase
MIPDLSLTALHRAYADGSTTPAQVLTGIAEHAAAQADRNIWIHRLTDAELRPYLDRLAQLDPANHPLWGVPFAIKDNIDLAGVPTTAACPAFAYTPTVSATVVERLLAAGAIPVGKTNLDQFATGLVGTRSPYGACTNAFDADYISGGSSAGSAVAVALGLASFSLGSDTAGSGRVPAAFNNLVGLKPTRGLLSARGMVPACRSLDCMSLFALNCDDAATLLAIAEATDPDDPYSHANPFRNHASTDGTWQGPLRIGVIAQQQLRFFGDQAYQQAYADALARLHAAGVETVPLDYAPFDEAAQLLYGGPWVAERYLAAQPLIDDDPDALLPVTRGIIAPGGQAPATDLFRAGYRLAALKGQAHATLTGVDCLLTPTAGRLFTRAEVAAEPVQRNTELGYYTNYMNLLDLSALAVQAGFTDAGLPFGVTLVGESFDDRRLLAIGRRLQTVFASTQGASGHRCASSAAPPVHPRRGIPVVVCGAHLDGLPLNWQLRARGATLLERTTTAAGYRLYALPGGPPYRPALVRDPDGAAIEVEVWSVPEAAFGSFVAGIPAPLGIGRVALADGRSEPGFICEAGGLDGATDITAFGGWRAYLEGRPRSD